MPDAIINPEFVAGLWDTPDTLSEYDDEVPGWSSCDQTRHNPCTYLHGRYSSTVPLSYSSDSA